MHLPALGGVRWRKVTRDLLQHRVRSLLVVLSIAVGVMAVGTIAGANALLERNLADGYAATKPSSASLFTTVPFDQGLVDVVRSMPDVAEAEGRRSATARMVKPDGETVELALTALPDFDAQTMDLVSPESGTWPPKRGEIVFERSSRTVADLQEGRTITVQLGPDKTRTLVTGGFAHEPGGAPAYFFGHRGMMKLAMLFLVATGQLPWPYLFAFLLFDIGYAITEKVSFELKPYHLKNPRRLSQGEIPILQRIFLS